MKWVSEFGTFEWIICITFVIFYSLFILRTIRVAKSIDQSPASIFWKLILRTTYSVLLIIALLGPSFGETSREIKSIGKDIFFCIDLSESMNATDIQPTRLEKIKFELKNIVEAFNSDRKGLIMFSNEAFMQCPLTYDNNALNLFIQTLSTTLVPNSGTDFGPPLEMAMKKISDDETSATRQTSKVIILISDGEDFGDDTESIAKKVEQEGITLFTLGVGTEKGSKIPGRRGFKTDRNGNEVVTKLNSTSLKKLAADTGGKYFEINDDQNDVDRLINTINLIEGELRDTRKLDAAANKYVYFLAAAFFLMVIELLWRVKLFNLG